MNNFRVVIFWIIFGLFSKNSYAENACDFLKQEKVPALFLIDSKNNLSKGPIDFGRFTYSFKSRDFVVVPTGYRLVVFPKRIGVEGTGEGIMGVNTILKPVTSLCKNSTTFSISYAFREARSNSKEDAFVLPLKISEIMSTVNFDDPKIELGEFDIATRFNARFIGEVVKQSD